MLGLWRLQFDGKLSVVRFRGRTLLYARANPCKSGCRWVQLAISEDDELRTWSPFRMLRMEGINTSRFPDKAAFGAELYYFMVQPWDDGLLALSASLATQVTLLL